MPLLPSTYYKNTGLQPLFPGTARRKSVNLPPSVVYLAGQLLAEQVGVNAQQTITITGSPTSGNFTLTGGALGATVISIPWNSTALQMQTLLNAAYADPPFLVTGGPGPATPYVITFAGQFTGTVQTLLTAAVGTMAGGSPAITPTSTRTGVAGTPGLFWAYDPTQTDGRQIPRGVLEYDASSDASSPPQITWGAGGIGAADFGFQLPYVPCFIQGIFKCGELIGLTDAAIAAAGWRLINGNSAVGELMIPGAG